MFLSRGVTIQEFRLCTQAPERITPIHHHPTREQRNPAALPLIFPLFGCVAPNSQASLWRRTLYAKFRTPRSRKGHEIEILPHIPRRMTRVATRVSFASSSLTQSRLNLESSTTPLCCASSLPGCRRSSHAWLYPSMAGLGASLGARPSAAFWAGRLRPLATPLRPARSGKLMLTKWRFTVSSRLAWVEDELMEIRESEEQSSVKSKKRPPLRRGKVSPQLTVPEHIIRPSHVGSKGLPELCKGQLPDAQGITGVTAACKLAAHVLDFAGTLVKPSVTTNEIDKAVHNMIIEAGAYPSQLGYRGFPKSICTSVNECVCHGIPDSTQLQNGDIINIDVNVFLNGYHGGTSRTFVCGQIDDSIKHFLKAAEECLEKGISVCRDGVNYRKIGKKISKLAYFYGYHVVERFVGHGIGTMYHSEPLILHHANENSGRMVEGQIFTIEPILSMEKTECVTWEDGWTTVTADGSWAAQFEHTILVTRNGAEILSKV